jgi:hypothetical protein
MIILREEIKSLQTVKGCLQLRISELEEESKKTRDELAQRSSKSEEEEVYLFYLLLVSNNILKFLRILYHFHNENDLLELKWLVFSWNVTNIKND